MSFESNRLQVLQEISELMKNSSPYHRIIFFWWVCIVLSPLFQEVWYWYQFSFAHWKISPGDFESFWVVKNNGINSIKIVPSRHMLIINVWWKLEMAGIHLYRWKPGSQQHLSALSFSIFFKIWFPELYYTTKIQKNVIVWYVLPWLYGPQFLKKYSLYIQSFLKWCHKEISVV